MIGMFLWDDVRMSVPVGDRDDWIDGQTARRTNNFPFCGVFTARQTIDALHGKRLRDAPARAETRNLSGLLFKGKADLLRQK